MKTAKVFLFSAMLLIACSNFVFGQNPDTMGKEAENITQRLRTLLTTNYPDSARTISIMHSLKNDGSWDGIDYYNTGRLAWYASSHLGYISQMAAAFSNPESKFYQNKSVEAAIHRALEYWNDHNFTSKNWWYNDIGAPETLSNILVMMGDKITDDELIRSLNLMRGAYLHQEGQNLVWRAGIQLKIGLATYNRGHINLLGSAEDRIRNSVATMLKEIVVTPEEGIQSDWSFHQHGAQLQFGNYGLVFAQTEVNWAWVLNESSLKFPEAKLSILKNYILKGLATVVWKNTMDLSACGRSLSPGNPESLAKSAINTINRLADLYPKEKETFKNYSDCLTGNTEKCMALPQNTYFWRSDFTNHRTSDYYFSVRTHSRFIQSTESGIGQNVSGAYLADGATYLYQTGKEYYNILPFWNWKRIPGTTAYPNEPIPEFGWNGLPNESDFVGGVSDGAFGISAMLFRRDGLSAHKSWFFGPSGLVCLGTGINTTKNTNVSTTINQSLSAGNIVVGIDKKKITLTSEKSLSRNDIDWVYHNGAGYIFLQKNKVHTGTSIQRGNWSKVYASGSEAEVKGNVFNLWIDHGKQSTDGSYAYAILPHQSIDSIRYYSKKQPVKIIRNDTTVQAVEYPGTGIAQIIFYKGEKVSTENAGTIQADSPCIVMIRKNTKDITISVATPPRHGKEPNLNYDGHPTDDSKQADIPDVKQIITISIQGQFKAENSRYLKAENLTQIKFELPGGIEQGKTIQQNIIKINS